MARGGLVYWPILSAEQIGGPRRRFLFARLRHESELESPSDIAIITLEYDGLCPHYLDLIPSLNNLETVLPIGITVYGETPVNEQIAAAAEAYPEIWRDTGGTVNVPEDQWMSIPTIPGAKPDSKKVYPLSPEDRKVADKEFDRLHQEGKMSWTEQPTPYEYPVLVVWRSRTIARAIIDFSADFSPISDTGQ